jgi:hypothetical protein
MLTGRFSARIVLILLAALLGSSGCGYIGAAVARPPGVTGVTPGTGTAFGGEIVTVTGSDFQPGATVVFGFLQATNVTVTSAFIIECKTPGFAPGQVPVIVNNPDGKSGTLNNGYIYLGPTPSMSTVSPSSGSVAGGTLITVTGSNFSPNATVTVGGTAATSVTVSSATQFTAVVPAGTLGPADVEITNVDLQSTTLTGGFTYQGAAPTVTSVSPSTGPPAGGTLITITGTGFLSGASVTVGGVAATGITVVSATSITSSTPAGTGAASVTVTNIDAQSGSLPSAFTYTGTGATVTSVSPTLGPAAGGTLVTITGTNFASGATITFGGTASSTTTFVNSTTYTAVTPAGTAGPANVEVTNPSASPGTLVNGFPARGRSRAARW